MILQSTYLNKPALLNSTEQTVAILPDEPHRLMETDADGITSVISQATGQEIPLQWHPV